MPRSKTYGQCHDATMGDRHSDNVWKKGFRAEFFRNTFFTHIPWARRPLGFERNSEADKKLRGIWCSQFDRPMLTIRLRTVKKTIFLVVFSINMQYLGGFGDACTLTGSATTRNTSCEALQPSRMDLKMGQNLNIFEFSGLRKSL